MLKIGIVGCGNIANIIASKTRNIKIVAVYDTNMEKAIKFAKLTDAAFCTTPEDVVASDCKLVVEAASPKAIMLLGEKVLKAKKDLLIMSVGGLAENNFREKLFDTARKNDARIYIPSGAIGGLDAVASASIGKIDEITLNTIKPPESLGLKIKERQIIFEGSPTEAIKRFPKNINVSVALSLFGGFDRVKVVITVDPAVSNNIHKIQLRGDFGQISMEFDNTPSPHKATSLIAAYSAVALLERLASPLRF
ncbi:MAG: aspartate dehydrogenase [Candidatus Methanofastidiosia archaeon]